MSRVTSLTSMSEKELNRWIKRIALVFVVLLIAFVALYAVDRFRLPQPAIVDQRIAALEAAVQKDPGSIAARGQLADAYAAKKRFAEAITQYTTIINANQDIELAKFGRAKAYLATDQLDLAAADFQAVVVIAKTGEMAVLDPTLGAAYYSLGDIAMRKGNAAEAVTQLENALRINTSDADALMLIGKAYTANGQPEKAIIALKRAVMFVPIGWVEPYQAMVEAYTKANQPEMAAWAAAMAEFQGGDHAKASADLKALTNGKAALDAYIGLGLIAETRGDLTAARDWYAKALVIDPTNPAAKLGAGRAGTAATPSASAAPSSTPSN